jgi:hypothetical protein
MKKYAVLLAIVSQISTSQIFCMKPMELDQTDISITKQLERSVEEYVVEVAQLINEVPLTDRETLKKVLKYQFECAKSLTNHCAHEQDSQLQKLPDIVAAYRKFLSCQPSYPTVENQLPDSIGDLQIELLNVARKNVQNLLIVSQGKVNPALTQALIHLAHAHAYPQAPTYLDTFEARVLLHYILLISYALDVLNKKPPFPTPTQEMQQHFLCIKKLQERGDYHDKLREAQKQLHQALIAPQ